MPDVSSATGGAGSPLTTGLQREIAAAVGRLGGVPPFILASASPRRRELLEAVGLRFEIVPADIPEVPQPGERPEAFVARAAGEKAAHIAAAHAGRSVLGADTVVALGDRILGKPRDRDHGRQMLQDLAGTTHRVCTGVTLIVAGEGAARTDVVVSHVTFRELSPADIEAYLDTHEPFDKAGAYAIQGGARRFVMSVAGSWSNVIGLPLIETAALFAALRRES